VLASGGGWVIVSWAIAGMANASSDADAIIPIIFAWTVMFLLHQVAA
jgi:hypothetical protein